MNNILYCGDNLKVLKKEISFLIIICLIVSCKEDGWIIMKNKDNFEKNFDSPQGAVLCLEDAYKSKDIKKILSCKDF